jgi:hypothetical protein
MSSHRRLRDSTPLAGAAIGGAALGAKVAFPAGHLDGVIEGGVLAVGERA